MRIGLQEAIELLKGGEVVAAPTETVYGLAASIHCPGAIQKIFTLKNRPQNNPLITHVVDTNQVLEFLEEVPEGFDRLAEAFWPGALTLVIPVKEELMPEVIRAGLPKAAFRVPNHPLIRELISNAGPLVMPSANLSGKPSSTAPEHVEADFGKKFPVLDGGICDTGIESTVLIAEGNKWQIGRLGGISPEEIETVLGYLPEVPIKQNIEKPLCPGQMYRHYAPRAKLHIGDVIPDDCTTILGFSERNYPEEKEVILLGSLDSPESVAKQLYKIFRVLDGNGVEQAWVDMDFPDNGLWMSIRERIKKAATE